MKQHSAAIQVVDVAALPPKPWKNGGGLTYELARHPEGVDVDDFLWRVSIANITRSGDFSVYQNIERVILLLEGDGMVLESAEGEVYRLTTPYVPYRFRGEDRVHAHLAGSASKDFNLMLRRDACSGEVETWYQAGAIALGGSFWVLFCAKGAWEVRVDTGECYPLNFQQALTARGSRRRIAVRPLPPNSILLCARITLLDDR